MIPQWKKDRCKWCAAGVRSAGATRQWHLPEGTNLMDATRCTAPTETEYIAELEARLKDSAEDTARLDWLASDDGGDYLSHRTWDEASALCPINWAEATDSGKWVRAAIDAARGAK